MATPLGADQFSIQGLRNLGPALQRWREEWQERLAKNPVQGLALPDGEIVPIGYIVMQPNLYGGQVTRAYERWLRQIPGVYRAFVLHQASMDNLAVTNDPCCLAVLRHYRSLMPMAQTARKPIFKLTAAGGAIGAHSQAVQQVGNEFRALAQKLCGRFRGRLDAYRRGVVAILKLRDERGGHRRLDDQLREHGKVLRPEHEQSFNVRLVGDLLSGVRRLVPLVTDALGPPCWLGTALRGDGGLLTESLVRARGVVVADVLGDDELGVPLVEDENVVEAFAT